MDQAPHLVTFVQLFAIGPQDLSLTVGPTHSFFPVGSRSWRTYDAFAKDPVVNCFNEPQPAFTNADVSPVFTCDLRRSGDLITSLLLEVELPVLQNEYAYVPDVGYRLIDSMSISVGGVQLDSMEGLHMIIKSHMSNTHVNGMVNGTLVKGTFDSGCSLQDDSAERRLILQVPIPFWFGRSQVSNGLPIAALMTPSPLVKLVLGKLSGIIQPTPPDGTVMNPKMTIVTDNVSLDPRVVYSLIRAEPTKSLYQQNASQNSPVDTSASVQRIELTCNRSVRRLLWLVTGPDDPPSVLSSSVLSWRLMMEGTDIVSKGPGNNETGDRVDGMYANLVQPYLYGTSSMPGVYSHTFALKAADVPYGGSSKKLPIYPMAPSKVAYESPYTDQPTGTFDFSSTRNFLELTLSSEAMVDGAVVHVYFECYNVLEQSSNELRPIYVD